MEEMEFSGSQIADTSKFYYFMASLTAAVLSYAIGTLSPTQPGIPFAINTVALILLGLAMYYCICLISRLPLRKSFERQIAKDLNRIPEISGHMERGEAYTEEDELNVELLLERSIENKEKWIEASKVEQRLAGLYHKLLYVSLGLLLFSKVVEAFLLRLDPPA